MSELDQEIDALMARVGMGDREAFRALYDRASGKMLSVALRLLRDRARAEEVLQDSFVRIWQSAGKFRSSRGRAMAWILRIVRNAAIDRLRKPAMAPGEGEAEPDQLAGDDVAQDDRIDFDEQAAQLQQCMSGLSSEQRDGIRLAYFEGLSHGQLASRLSQPLGTVKSWIRRGLKSLRDCMDSGSEVSG